MTEGVSSLRVTNTTPPPGATNVPVNTTITVTFNDNIKPGPSYAKITLNSPSGAFTPVITGNTLTITPTSNLPYNRWTLLTIPADALLSTVGTPMTGTLSTSFTTVIPLTATNATPPPGATNVPVNTTITVTFNHNIKPGPIYAKITLISPSGAFTPVITGNTLTITPTSILPYNRWTLLTIPADALLSTAGTPMTGTLSTSFTT